MIMESPLVYPRGSTEALEKAGVSSGAAAGQTGFQDAPQSIFGKLFSGFGTVFTAVAIGGAIFVVVKLSKK